MAAAAHRRERLSVDPHCHCPFFKRTLEPPPPHLCTACGLLVPIVWWDGTLLGASSTQVSASSLSLVPMQAHFLCAAQRASFPSYYTCCSLLSWTCVLTSASMTCCQRWDKVTHPGVCCPALGCSCETGMNPWSRASSAELNWSTSMMLPVHMTLASSVWSQLLAPQGLARHSDRAASVPLH